MKRALLIVAAVALHVFAGASASTAAGSPSADAPNAAGAEFWFVEANEGQSAGGHAALRLGPRVYHLEHRGDGLIADRRTSPRRFIEVYADRDNRRIEVIPLDLNQEQIRALESLLATRFSSRTRRLAVLDSLEDEIRWLASVEEKGMLALRVPGLGLFQPEQRPGVCGEDVPLARASHRSARSAQAALRDRLTHQFGRAGIQKRKVAARRETEARIAATLNAPDEQGGRLRALIQAARTEFALRLLFGCEGKLRPNALIRTRTPLGARRAIWTAAQGRLANEIEALLESPRTDTGLPLLLAWARMAAIAETLISNQIHVLAPFEENRPTKSRSFTQSSVSVADEVPPTWRGPRKQEAAARWSRSMTEFARGDGPFEVRLLEIERAHHALRHLEGRTLHDPIRPESRSPSPAEAYASGSRILPWPSGTRFSAVQEARRAREKAAASLRRSLDDELRYGLFTRNCVTELSAALEAIRSREDQSDRVDGKTLFAGVRGRLSAKEVIQGAFIPEVAALRVEALLSTRVRRTLPSTRERALAEAREKIETPLSRWALEGREFMTLTSQTYRPNQDDSRFLFFADGPLAIRPLIGLANLGYGVAASLFGLLEAPFDRGIGLRRGVQGIVMSVPELFFFQVRQGSYRVAPPRALAPSAGSTETR